MIALFRRFNKFSKIPIWLLSVVLAVLFWTNNKMVEIYNYSYSIPIRYNEIPKNLAFTKDPPDKFTVTIHETGKKLFDILFEHQLDSVFIDINQNWKIGNNYIVVDKKDIKWKDLGNNVYHYLNKNSFTVTLDTIKERFIPINPDIELNINEQFVLIEKPKLIKSKILGKGAKSIIDNIPTLITKINEKMISEKGTLFLNLKINENDGVNLENDSVTVELKIDKKVQRVIDEIPVKIINRSARDSNFTINYESISIVAEGGEQVLNNLSAIDFNVFIDFSTVDFTQTNDIKPKITSFKKLSNIRSYPEKVKIIRKIYE